ncbi:methylamine utilization protein MauE [Nonomuraea phyllanthi]|uniref:Methylamine utilization protein MauE n=1 Tax=Nonomuraea phyllanthi TaxID=2219224 RepID=A0A5C4WKT7_9ACTN|nr:methylamine utilization protein MauE [Nonomuraea phyllanthi]
MPAVSLLLVACQVLIGAVFAVSAFTKLRGRAAMRSFASSLTMLPARLRLAAAGVVAAGEAAVAALMVVPRAGLPLAGVLLCGFCAVIVITMRQGLRVPCRCFGSSGSHLGPVHLVRNGLLLTVVALGWTALAVSGAPPTVAQLAIAVPAGLAGAILMIAWDDIADLFKETSGSV